jgi:dTDP-4-dehydrorhamnose reductase
MAPSQATTPILLISPDGMLGRAMQALLVERAVAFDALSYPSVDITSAANVASVVLPRFRVVINCAAFTDVDGAETRETDAEAVNALGVGLLAERCRQTGALLVHYSTDYVFDGAAKAPYRVDEPRRPQTAYGRGKAKGEELLLAAGCEYLLLRTSWLYAPWGKNFVDTMARLGQEQPVLRVVHDQRGRPSSAEYVAQRSLALIEHGARGTFHLTDGGECSWFEFARAIVQQTGGSARVDACTSAQYVRPAPRPSYSVLDLSATEALLGPTRPWQDNLAQVLQTRARLGKREQQP